MKIKSILSVLTAAAVMTMGGAGMNVQAKNAEPVDNVDINGNKCGFVSVKSEIEANVNIKIKCDSPDMTECLFFDETIEKNATDNSMEFVLEGNDEFSYTIIISVPKYKSSNTYDQSQSFTFKVRDTDEILKEDVAGYKFSYTVADGSRLEEEVITKNQKDKDNFYINETNLYFHVENSVKGDANSDGKLDIRDAAAIAGSIAKGNQGKLPGQSDFNGDGQINIRDAAAIAKYLAGVK